MKKKPSKLPRLLPVAEYMGVALLEGGEGHKVVWEDVEYETDGNCYLLLETEDGIAQVHVIPPQEGVTGERTAKGVIEGMSDDNRKKALNILDCFVMFKTQNHAREHKEWVANGGRFEWDDEKSAFVRTEPEMFGQGKTR